MALGFIGREKEGEPVVRERAGDGPSPDSAISVIGPGMKVVGDCDSDGTIRIDGEVKGTVRAGKAVVVGKEGVVDGDIYTQDAVLSGRVLGTVTAESRLELQATCRIEGEVFARRMQLEEGAILNGSVHMGEKQVGQSSQRAEPHGSSDTAETGSAGAPSPRRARVSG